MTEPEWITGPFGKQLVIDGQLAPGEGPIDGVSRWCNKLYVARAGCIWVARGDGWVLADGVDMPPSFPPRREREHVDEA